MASEQTREEMIEYLKQAKDDKAWIVRACHIIRLDGERIAELEAKVERLKSALDMEGVEVSDD